MDRSKIQNFLELDTWLKEFAPEEICMISRFAILPEYRNTELSGSLILNQFALTVDQNVQLALVDCVAGLVPYYEKIGFLPFQRNFYISEYKKEYTPLALLADDISYFKQINSPFQFLAFQTKRPGKSRLFFEKTFSPKFVLPIHNVLRTIAEPFRYYFTNDELKKNKCWFYQKKL